MIARCACRRERLPHRGSSRSKRLGARMAAAQGAAPGPLQQVLFVETGVGADQHGQNVTKACVRACRNAIEFNSLPAIKKIVPGGYEAMRLHVKTEVNVDELRKVFPYGIPTFEIVEGGLCCGSGIVVPEHGDTTDEFMIAVAAITVGY